MTIEKLPYPDSVIILNSTLIIKSHQVRISCRLTPRYSASLCYQNQVENTKPALCALLDKITRPLNAASEGEIVVCFFN